MNKTQAQNSFKRLSAEASNLNPTTLISLFEIDFSSIIETLNPISYSSLNIPDYTFRFHNHINLTTLSLFYDSNLDNFPEEFIAAPIIAEGFEITSKGTLPTPRMAISVDETGIAQLTKLKLAISNLDSLIGAKVTRIRTFLSCLPKENFPNNINPYGEDGFAEFPRDIYYIDRKSNESKSVIEYELASILDVEGVQLPTRIVMSDRCPWQYRGDGCFYEYNANRSLIHGSNSLPTEAPPVANDRDELISDILGIPFSLIIFPDADRKWKSSTNYNIGNACFIEKSGIKYYYVAKLPNNNKQPPNDTYWIGDRCSKLTTGCNCRWGINAKSNNLLPYKRGVYPFGGFPGVGKAR